MTLATAPDAREVSHMLAMRIEDLAAQCLPNGTRIQNEWCVGSINGEPGQSLRVRLNGNKAGWWIDFSDRSSKGDALDLVRHALCNGDRKAAYKWALGYLGLAAADTAAVERARRRARESRQRAERAAAADAEKTARRAKALWLSGAPDITNTPAAEYLAGRGIDTTRLARPPRALRYQKQTWCSERKIKAPAMLAAATNDRGELVCCHRTYLGDANDGDDWHWRKARINDAKKV